MKLIVISDIHGSGVYMQKIDEIIEKIKPNKIIVLGDILYKSRFVDDYNPIKVIDTLNKYKDNIICVKGNCDSEEDLESLEFKIEENQIIEYNNKKVLLTHGDRYNIDNIPYGDFDIMMYGHIHQGFIEKRYDILFLNPGSISSPKGLAKNSFIVINDNLIELKDFEDNVIQNYEMED